MRCRTFDYGSEILDTDIAAIDTIEDADSMDALTYQFTLEQSSAVNENIRLEDNSGLLLEETDGDNIIGEDDSSSVGESILIESSADTGDPSYFINEDYIVGDQVTDKVNQNELFDELDDTILDFSESNPFGDAGEPS
jgi:hypothetical protein